MPWVPWVGRRGERGGRTSIQGRASTRRNSAEPARGTVRSVGVILNHKFRRMQRTSETPSPLPTARVCSPKSGSRPRAVGSPSGLLLGEQCHWTRHRFYCESVVAIVTFTMRPPLGIKVGSPSPRLMEAVSAWRCPSRGLILREAVQGCLPWRWCGPGLFPYRLRARWQSSLRTLSARLVHPGLVAAALTDSL